jgi:PPOX class probable F420-dependent enzyme
MNRRKQIEMTPEEQRRFLETEKTAVLCSIDRQGYPHAVAMWFCLIEGLVHMTTFRRSQKVVNLRRDPRATLLVESGDQYAELRGLMIRGRAEIDDDLERCARVLMGVQARYGGQASPEMLEVLRPQAAKRVIVRVHPERVSSWDHSKLGGVY